MTRWLWLAAFAAACVKPIPVDILSARPPEAAFAAPRACAIEVAPVVDGRPTVEREGGGQARLKYLVPLLIWFQWESAGPVYGRPELYARDLLPDLRTLLQRTVDGAAICAGGGPRLTLRPTVEHYYGVSYYKSFAAISLGGGAAVEYTFHPAAEVALSLDLLDGERIVGHTTITERYLYNPADEPVGASTTRQRAPAIALSRAMARVPDAVDRLLAQVDGATSPPADGTFLVARVLREYDFQEELQIETATGRIVSDRVVRGRLPILAGPGEWVVVPVDAAGRWLSNDAYRELVDVLAVTYDVSFDGDLSAATFRGLRPRG